MTKNTSEHLIQNVPEDELPMEKYNRYGASALTDAELLAIVLRSGTQGVNVLSLSRRLCALDEGFYGLLGLCHTTEKELEAIRGIGHVKAVQLLCIAEISRRISKARTVRELDFHLPETIAEHYMEDMRHASREEVRLLMLDTRLRLIREKILSVGTVNTAAVSVREICREALLGDSVYMVLLHNHPSGDPTPSPEDLQMTEQLRKAGQLVGVPLLDHIIIGDQCFISLQEYLQNKKGIIDS